jgi:hypothetical protein
MASEESAADVLERLKSLAGEIASAPEVSLVMAAAYGSLARGNYRPGRSDANLLCVLERMDPDTLDRLRPLVSAGRHELWLAPFLLTRAELGRAADAFAAKLADVRDAYRLLAGQDVLQDLPISLGNVRLACEREVRDTTLRMRRAYLLGAAQPAVMRVTLERMVPSLIGTLRVLVRQTKPDLGGTEDALLDALGAVLGFDPEPLRSAAELRAHPEIETDLAPHYVAILPVLDRIVKAVDEYPK